MNKIFSSLQTKLFFFCLILSLFLSVILSWQLYQIINESFQKEKAAAVSYNLELIAENVARDLETLYQTVLFCSSNTEITKFMTEKDWRSYTSYPVSMTAYEQLRIRIFNSPIENYVNKIILCSYDGDYIIQGKNYGLSTDVQNCLDQPFFADLLSSPGYMWIGLTEEPFSSSPPGTRSLPVVRPVIDSASGSPLGWIYIALDPSIVSHNISAEQSSFYWIIGENVYEFVDGTFQSCDMRWENLGQNQAKVYVQGQENAAVCIQLRNSLWTFIQTIPKTDRFISNSSRPIKLLPFIAVVFFSLLLFSYFLKKCVSDPVLRICNQLDEISSGKFTQNISLETADEFGYIGKSINNMSSNIQRLMKRQLETEEEKRRLELDSLQSQISPHFLYNTLYTIKWMAVLQNASGISEMLDCLAQIMKAVSKNTDSKTTVRNELALLKNYITILKYRYGDMFTYQEIVEDDSLLDCLIFKFSLQPIIENSIFHGFRSKQGQGILSLMISQEENDLVIQVTDNGVGIAEDQVSSILDDHSFADNKEMSYKKIGLKNINKRLKLEYGEAYGLQISSQPGKYTKITVRYPISRHQEI